MEDGGERCCSRAAVPVMLGSSNASTPSPKMKLRIIGLWRPHVKRGERSQTNAREIDVTGGRGAKRSNPGSKQRAIHRSSFLHNSSCCTLSYKDTDRRDRSTAADTQSPRTHAATVVVRRVSVSRAMPEEDSQQCCWICMEDGGELLKACRCPTLLVHSMCLSRWQLHSAGTREEVECRFCGDSWRTDWKTVLCSKAAATQPAVPVVAVIYEGVEFRLKVVPTPEGMAAFRQQVELITGVPWSREVDVKFFCKSPSGDELMLRGAESLAAAIACASYAAAERQADQQGPAGAAVQQQAEHCRRNTAAGAGSRPPAGHQCSCSSSITVAGSMLSRLWAVLRRLSAC